MTKLTRAEQDEVLALYRRGLTIREVAQRVYWSATAVRNVLVVNGEPRRQRGSRAPMLATEEKLRTSQLYGAGLSMQELANLLGLHVSTVHRRLHRFGAITRPVGGRHPGQPRPLSVLRRIESDLGPSKG